MVGLKTIRRSCFRPMPILGRFSCLPFQRAGQTAPGKIKLLMPDGLVKIYDRPVCVSELMLEFPKHMVCRSDEFYIGQKVPALAEDEQLQLGHSYFILPSHFFQSVLSFVTITSFAASISSQSKSQTIHGDPKKLLLKKTTTCQPFDIQKAPSGCLRIRVSEEFLSQVLVPQDRKGSEGDEEIEEKGGKSRSSVGCGKEMNRRVCSTPLLRKEYTQLVGYRRPWKPSVDTIRESSETKRKLGSLVKRRRKKSQCRGGSLNSNKTKR